MCQSPIFTDHKVTRFVCLTSKVKERYASFLPFIKECKMLQNILTLRLIFNAYFWKLFLLQWAGSIIQLYFLRLYSLDLYIHSISKDTFWNFISNRNFFFVLHFLKHFLLSHPFISIFFVTAKIGMQSKLPWRSFLVEILLESCREERILLVVFHSASLVLCLLFGSQFNLLFFQRDLCFCCW